MADDIAPNSTEVDDGLTDHVVDDIDAQSASLAGSDELAVEDAVVFEQVKSIYEEALNDGLSVEQALELIGNVLSGSPIDAALKIELFSRLELIGAPEEGVVSSNSDSDVNAFDTTESDFSLSSGFDTSVVDRSDDVDSNDDVNSRVSLDVDDGLIGSAESEELGVSISTTISRTEVSSETLTTIERDGFGVDDVARLESGNSFDGFDESGFSGGVTERGVEESVTLVSSDSDSSVVSSSVVDDTSGVADESVNDEVADEVADEVDASPVAAVDTVAPVLSVTGAISSKDGAAHSLASGDTAIGDSVQLSGVVEVGSTVSVYNGNAYLGEATVQGGSWTFTTTLSDAVTYQLSAKATDVAGNESLPTVVFTVTGGDTSAPTVSAPEITGLTSGDSTNASVLTLTGTAEAGTTINIYDGSGTTPVNGSTVITADVNGDWSYVADIADGTTYQFNAKAKDAAGNESAPTANFEVTGDTTAPTVTAPSISGLVSGDSTNASTLTLTGTAEAGATIHIYNDTDLVNSSTVVTADENGDWSYAVDIADGTTYQFNATATDAAGNISAASANFDVTGDTSAPNKPALISVNDNVGDVQGDLSSGDTTDDDSLLLTGTAEAGATINIYNGTSPVNGGTVVTADANGDWSYTASIVSGTTYDFTVTATDAAGNESAATDVFQVIGGVASDGSGSVELAITTVTDDQGGVIGALTSGDTTDDTSLVLQGTTPEGTLSVAIYNGDTYLGEASVTGTTWTYTATIEDDTTYQFNATSTDAASNESTPTANFEVTGDTTAPVVTAPSINGLVSGDSTNQASLTLTGTAEAGAVINIFDGSGTTPVNSGTTITADANGDWSYTVDIADGTTYQFNATATDAAGNVSAASSNFEVTGDTSAPNKPALISVNDNVGDVQGDLSSGDTTDDDSLLLTGTAEAGATINIYNGTSPVNSGTVVTADANGDWSYTATIVSGTTYDFTVTATDAAGNESAATDVFQVIGGGNVQVELAITTVTDDQGGVIGALTSGDTTDDTSLVLQGTTPEGTLSVSIYNGDTYLGEASVTGTTWTYTATIEDGTTYQFNATSTDAASNESTPTANFEVTGDTTAPVVTAPSINGLVSGDSANQASLTLTGTAEAGAVINIFDGSGTTAVNSGTTITADANGDWSYTVDIADGTTYQFNATATDAAGNVSAASANFEVTGDTTAPTVSAPQSAGLTSGDSTNQTSLTLTGTAEEGATITIYNGTELVNDGIVITADANGDWSYAVTIEDGKTYQFNAKATDAAGNESAASTNFEVTGDTVDPVLAIIAVIDNQGDVQGQLTSGNSTDDSSLTLSGIVEAGSTVQIYNGASLLGEATVTGSTWTYEVDIANGVTYELNAKATDTAGNESAATTNFTVTGDTLEAQTPVLLSVNDNEGSVTGDLVSGDTTDDSSLLLTGTMEEGATVKIYNGNEYIGDAQVLGTSWSYVATIVDSVTYNFKVTATDEAGNESVPTEAFQVTGSGNVQSTIPTITSITDDQGSLQGELTSGDTTDDGELLLTGTVVNGFDVNVYDGANLLGQATISDDGTTWTYLATIDSDVVGGYQFNVRSVDQSDSTISDASATFRVTGDVTEGAVPILNAISDNEGDITGELTSGAITDDSTVVLTGTVDKDSTDSQYLAVKVYNGTTFMGDATVINGNWTYTAVIEDGVTYQFNITSIDSAGNESDPTTDFEVTGDFTAPVVTMDSPMNSSGVTLNSGDATNETSLALTGTVNEVGTVVKVYNGDEYVGDATVTGTTWSYSATLEDGVTYKFNAIATDAAGNDSVTIDDFVITGDTTAPVLAMTAVTDDEGELTGLLTTGDTTDDGVLVLSGIVEAGSTVEIFNNGVSIGHADVDGSTWRYEVTVEDGVTYQYSAKATDAAGNESAVTTDFEVTGDISAAQTPVLVSVTDNVGDITGDLESGDTTDDDSLVLSGTMEEGATVRIYNGDNYIGDAQVSGTSWTYSATIVDGITYNFNVTAVDAAGNESAPTEDFQVIGSGNVQSTIPVITSVVDSEGSITGNLSSGASTDDTSLVFSGTAVPGYEVRIYDGVSFVGNATVASDGSWTYEASIVNGTSYQFNARSYIEADGESTPSTTFKVTGDTVAGNTPYLLSAADDVGSVQGNFNVSASGQVTDDTSVLLSGFVESGLTVQVYNGNEYVGEASVSNGVWSYEASIEDGETYQFNAVSIDAAGNTSAPSTDFEITGDTTAPEALIGTSSITVTDDEGSVTGVLTAGSSTDDSSLTLTGTTEVGATVAIYNGNLFVADATVESDGSWSYTAIIVDGQTYQFNAKATDVAGNESAATTNFAVTGDTSAPTLAIISLTDDQGDIVGTLTSGRTTDDTQLELTGIVEAGASVEVFNDGVFVGDATVNGTTWTFNADVEDGITYNFTATATDAAGNVSAATPAFTTTVDLTAAEAPVITAVYDNAGDVTGELTSGGTTDDGSLLITGTAEAGATISLYNGSELVNTTTVVTADSSGNWSYNATILDGVTYNFSAKATDAAGNESVSSADFTITGSAISNSIPTLTSALADVDGNAVSLSSGDATNTSSLTLSGTANANSTVRIYSNGSYVGDTLAGSDGAWTYTASLTSDTTYNFTMTSTVSGVESAASSAFSVTKDTVNPVVSLNTSVTDDEGSITGTLSSGSTTDDTSLTLTGTAEVGSIIKIYDANAASPDPVNGTTVITADENGAWSYTVTIEDGVTHDFTATSTDAAGNESAASANNFIVTGDTTTDTPTWSAVTENANGTDNTLSFGDTTNDTSLVLTGTAEAGSVINIYNGDGSDPVNGSTVITTDSSGNWSYTATVEHGKSYLLTAKATDVVGNVSAVSTTFLFTVDTSAPIVGITTVTDDEGLVKGGLLSGLSTDDATLAFTGVVEAGATVEIFDGDVSLGYANVSGTTWSFDVAIEDGTTHQITAQATNALGNSGSTPVFTVTGDSTAATASTVNDGVAWVYSANTTSESDPKTGSTLTLTFNEPVYLADVSLDDFTTPNGALEERGYSYGPWGSGGSIVANDLDADGYGTSVTITLGGYATIYPGEEIVFDATDKVGNQAEVTWIRDPETVVVFNLETQKSSDHSDQTFDADVSYTIYIIVPESKNSLGGVSTSEMWSGAENLGDDDKVILVGSDSGDVLQGLYGNEITRYISGNVWASSRGNGLNITASGDLYRRGSFNHQTDLWDGTWVNINTGLTFNEVYKTYSAQLAQTQASAF